MVMYGSSIFFILEDRSNCTTAGSFGAHAFWNRTRYAVAGGMSTAGSLTRWFRDNFAPGGTGGRSRRRPQRLCRAWPSWLRITARRTRPGRAALLRRRAHAAPRPRCAGPLFGLTLSHTRGDLYRALLEAVGYGIRHNLDAMRGEGMAPARILAVGGGTLNRAWMQMVSDIAGIEQHIPAQQIGAAYGDAFLAGVGVGLFPDTSAAASGCASAR